MKRIAAIALAVTLGLAGVAITPTEAHPFGSRLKNIGTTGHHVYAYTGERCTGTRYKLERGQYRLSIVSFKSPWAGVLEGANSTRFGVPAKYCLDRITRYGTKVTWKPIL